MLSFLFWTFLYLFGTPFFILTYIRELGWRLLFVTPVWPFFVAWRILARMLHVRRE